MFKFIGKFILICVAGFMLIGIALAATGHDVKAPKPCPETCCVKARAAKTEAEAKADAEAAAKREATKVRLAAAKVKRDAEAAAKAEARAAYDARVKPLKDLDLQIRVAHRRLDSARDDVMEAPNNIAAMAHVRDVNSWLSTIEVLKARRIELVGKMEPDDAWKYGQERPSWLTW